jgi:hypothetical protein
MGAGRALPGLPPGDAVQKEDLTVSLRKQDQKELHTDNMSAVNYFSMDEATRYELGNRRKFHGGRLLGVGRAEAAQEPPNLHTSQRSQMHAPTRELETPKSPDGNILQIKGVTHHACKTLPR